MSTTRHEKPKGSTDDVPDVIELDRDELREERPKIIVPSGKTSTGRMHIAGMLGAFCGNLHHNDNTNTLRCKHVSVYPKDYKKWCRSCVYVWLHGRLPPANDVPEVEYVD